MKKTFIILSFLGSALIFAQCKKSSTSGSEEKQPSISYPVTGNFGANILSMKDSTVVIPSSSFSLAAKLQGDIALKIRMTNLSEGDKAVWFDDAATNQNWNISGYNLTSKQQTFTSFTSKNGGSLDLRIYFADTAGKCKIDFFENNSDIPTKSNYLKWHLDTIPPYKVIFYKKFTPDTNLTLTGTSQPTLDLNNDGEMDIRFDLVHWIEWQGHYQADCYKVTILPTDGLQFFHSSWNTPCGSDCDVPANSTMYMNYNDFGLNQFRLYWISSTNLCYCMENGGYIGFWMQKNGVNYLGWIHLYTPSHDHVIIDDFATLQSASDSVRIGAH